MQNEEDAIIDEKIDNLMRAEARQLVAEGIYSDVVGQEKFAELLTQRTLEKHSELLRDDSYINRAIRFYYDRPLKTLRKGSEILERTCGPETRRKHEKILTGIELSLEREAIVAGAKRLLSEQVTRSVTREARALQRRDLEHQAKVQQYFETLVRKEESEEK